MKSEANLSAEAFSRQNRAKNQSPLSGMFYSFGSVCKPCKIAFAK